MVLLEGGSLEPRDKGTAHAIGRLKVKHLTLLVKQPIKFHDTLIFIRNLTQCYYLILYTDTTLLYYGNKSKIWLLLHSISELACNAVFTQGILMFYTLLCTGSGLAIMHLQFVTMCPPYTVFWQGFMSCYFNTTEVLSYIQAIVRIKTLFTKIGFCWKDN